MMYNYEIRSRAHKALKPHLPIVLVMTLIATLPGLIASLVTILTNSQWQAYLLTLSIDAESVVYTGATEQLITEMLSFLRERGWINITMELLSTLITPVLQLGLFHTLLQMLRGVQPEVPHIFSRKNFLMRALGLHLYMLLRLFLWMIPGIAMAVIGILTAEFFEVFAMSLMAAGMIFSMVMTIRASYSYAMATLIQADLPQTPIHACLKRSVLVMKGRRRQLFSLELIYIGWTILINMLVSGITGVIGTTINMVLQLVVSVFMYTARCAFYEFTVKEQ